MAVVNATRNANPTHISASGQPQQKTEIAILHAQYTNAKKTPGKALMIANLAGITAMMQRGLAMTKRYMNMENALIHARFVQQAQEKYRATRSRITKTKSFIAAIKQDGTETTAVQTT
jgi:hypothetical protein